MNIVWAIVLLFGGLAILWKSADLLVGGAVRLAKRLGVSPLVIGLTVVAMGTSAPEMAAGIAAAVRGIGDIAIGDVYGSNIANLALVGGLCAIIRPIGIQLRTLRREMPIMVLVALLLWPILHNLYLSRPEGFALLAVFAGLIMLTVYTAQKDKISGTEEQRNKGTKEQKNKDAFFFAPLCFVIIGLAGLALGADMTVRGAVFIGKQIGLSEAVIGLTIIAVGTSLPELVTCLVATVKKHHDISIGILVGSNIFNTLLVTGTAGTIRPFSLGQRLAEIDYWVMVIVSASFVLMALIGRRISRINGALLLCGYVAYMIYLLVFSA
ncbi:MAG: calcium/sodium antiporter [Planctomycetota bacterium]|nr:MAG: calcium/sodium antiporter [Planctomycetota bacterium]